MRSLMKVLISSCSKRSFLPNKQKSLPNRHSLMVFLSLLKLAVFLAGLLVLD